MDDRQYEIARAQVDALTEIAARLREISARLDRQQPVNVSVSTGLRLRFGRRGFGRLRRMGMSTRGGGGRGVPAGPIRHVDKERCR